MEKFNKIKYYLTDRTIKGFNVLLKLINNEEYSFLLDNDEFNKLKDWYESNKEINYEIKIGNKNYNINKEYIIEFEYEDITNKKDLFNKFMYFFTKPIPTFMNIRSFFRFSIIIGIIGFITFIYQANMKNLNITDLMKGTEIYRTSILLGLNITFALFLMLSIIFMMKFCIDIIFNKISFYSEVRKNKKEKFYNFNIVNLMFLIFINYLIIRI